MAKFAIIGDSTCDLTTEMRKERDIDYARMLVSWTDVKDKSEHEIYASLDWDQGLTVKEYYDVLRAGNRIITSQVTEQEFDEVFSRHLSKGEDVLYISCSSGLSASSRSRETGAVKSAIKQPTYFLALNCSNASI
jgi:fatty acid-binding protein DegV